MSHNGSSGLEGSQVREADDAWTHLRRIRHKVAAYATVQGFVRSEIFLPSMSGKSMRSAGGSALIELLKALDAEDDGQVETDDLARFSHVPFLIVTLLHEETGVRVALLGAAYCPN